jgi:hypothetical protein
MRRWHTPRERAIMLRRWRQEIAKHEDDPFGYAPLPPVGEEFCHCYRGMGFLRKRKPHDCGRPRCWLCHGEKFYAAKARAKNQRDAIEFELGAWG